MERHRILGDKVILYRRAKGGNWHSYTFLKGTEWRKSTKEKSLAKAKDVATDWYMDLTAKDHLGQLHTGKTFAEAAKKFEEEYEAMIDTSLVNVRRERPKRKDQSGKADDSERRPEA